MYGVEKYRISSEIRPRADFAIMSGIFGQSSNKRSHLLVRKLGYDVLQDPLDSPFRIDYLFIEELYPNSFDRNERFAYLFK
jgi:hypothetical protein